MKRDQNRHNDVLVQFVYVYLVLALTSVAWVQLIAMDVHTCGLGDIFACRLRPTACICTSWCAVIAIVSKVHDQLVDLSGISVDLQHFEQLIVQADSVCIKAIEQLVRVAACWHFRT